MKNIWTVIVSILSLVATFGVLDTNQTPEKAFIETKGMLVHLSEVVGLDEVERYCDDIGVFTVNDYDFKCNVSTGAEYSKRGHFNQVLLYLSQYEIGTFGNGEYINIEEVTLLEVPKLPADHPDFDTPILDYFRK